MQMQMQMQMLTTVVDNKVIRLTPGECTVYVIVDNRINRFEHTTPSEARKAYDKIINYRTLAWK